MLEFSPDELVTADQQAAEAAVKAVQSKNKFLALDKTEKDFLSELIIMAEKTHGEASQTKLECFARASEEWKEFKRGLIVAEQEFNLASVRAKNAERRFECMQSCLSFRKEELKRIL